MDDLINKIYQVVRQKSAKFIFMNSKTYNHIRKQSEYRDVIDPNTNASTFKDGFVGSMFGIPINIDRNCGKYVICGKVKICTSCTSIILDYCENKECMICDVHEVLN